ncbi:type VI secretion system secreted protein Hcp [Enterobacter sp. BIGb0383]|uniref:Hcp family type VI secretion system effector n=1 Tax=unclassified Enterobacter TaxID=2608935 RepID=UPI000F48EDC2|nr:MULTISPECIES: type VI secretion system tube protein TssD [unclassified Enterobacter]ROP59999.1 type VI secretion system secreted protein Hcp [Enterobacter sp. BIGb0383]ROS08532.1 type VI secretion system secreted protein Hcp [Enterobacter sp. BIGb0359]
MAIPVYMHLTDDAGNRIKGSVDISGRENSIEILGLHHGVSIPTDSGTGRITGTRSHLAYLIEKETDASTPWLYQALSTGKTLKSAELKFYRINHAGQEEEYFNTLLENVKVVTVLPLMHDVRNQKKSQFNHMEAVELRYEKITWHYLDGNIIHSDSWNTRKMV